MNTEEEHIIKAYKTAIKQFRKGALVDFAKAPYTSLSCFVLRLETILANVGLHIQRNQSPRYQLLLVLKGRGRKTINNQIFPFATHSLFVIPPGTTHETIYDDEEVKGYFMSFEVGFFFQAFFPRHYLEGKRIFKPAHYFIPVQRGEACRLALLLEEILEECSRENKLREELLTVKVIELLILCERYYLTAFPHSLPYREQPLFRRFQDLVTQNFKEQHLVHFYATRLNTHPNYLNHVVKQQTGYSAKKFIEKTLANEAQHLLLNTPLSVKEIAYELGFGTPQHFLRFFKRNLHQSPVALRETAV